MRNETHDFFDKKVGYVICNLLMSMKNQTRF